MKRIIALAFAAALLFTGMGEARADGIDIKVKGQWDFTFGWVGNSVFKDSANRSNGNNGSNDNDKFQASQRIRTQINFITSEYLQGVLMFEIGMTDWGSGGTTGGNAGGRIDTDGVNIKTKRAYLDWMIPYTEVSVRMGLQGLTLPSTPLGSPLFDADVAGIVISSPITDWLEGTLFWIRPFDAYRNDNEADFAGSGMADETDVFGILLPMSFDDFGLAVTPWFMYGFIGANSGVYDYIFTGEYDNLVEARDSRSNAWWVGAHLEFTLFDPLVFNLEAIYGHMRATDLTGLGGIVGDRTAAWSNGYSNEIGTSGWYLGATLDYQLDFMTPGIFGWWASGDKEDSGRTGKLGRMPVLGNDGGSFAPTSFGTAGYYSIGQFDNGRTVTGTGTGTWGIGLQIADISFVEDLSHTLRFAYYQGTNDSELIKQSWAGPGKFYTYAADYLYLTDEDSVFEINFDHQYKIYENLTAVLELGWLQLNTDKATWRQYRTNADFDGNFKDSDNAWKAQVSFRYEF